MGGRRILVTGGAGFIGSHLADHLLERGEKVRALDVLSPKVHGPGAGRTDYLDDLNVYGTRQALSNPYTGVLALFAARYLNGRPPLVNEDGRQRRDFVAARDVAEACRLALEVPGAAGEVFNVGTFEDGLEELATWLEGKIAHDRAGEASAELPARGLSP